MHGIVKCQSICSPAWSNAMLAMWSRLACVIGTTDDLKRKEYMTMWGSLSTNDIVWHGVKILRESYKIYELVFAKFEVLKTDEICTS